MHSVSRIHFLTLISCVFINDMYLIQCWEGFNKPVDGVPRPYPVCSATLTQFMTAAKDAPTCLRRQEMFAGLSGDTTLHLCDRLIDQNIIAFVPPSNKTAKQTFEHESVFVLTTRVGWCLGICWSIVLAVLHYRIFLFHNFRWTASACFPIARLGRSRPFPV